MTVTLDQLEKWLTTPSETEHLEFKEAKNNFHFEKLVEYCVALANEGGGNMVLGVTDKPPRAVVGTRAFDTPAKTVAGIHQRLHFKVECTELSHANGRVLVFTIPSRPQGHPIQYNGKYLMRAGEELAPMSPDQLKRIFSEGESEYVDQVVLSGCSAEEVARLLDLQSYFDLKERPFPSTRQEAIETFLKKGFLNNDNGAYAITNLGALLFAKNLEEIDNLQQQGCAGDCV